jgi:hypothetical protein
MTTTSVYLLAHRTTLAELKCRFGCSSPVVAIIHAPQGCHCFSDPVQALCAQHALSIDGGPVTPIIDFRKFAGAPDDEEGDWL